MGIRKYDILVFWTFFLWGCAGERFTKLTVHETVVGNGWANNSVNATIFRKNSLTTFKDVQFTAFYDPSSHLILAKRKLGSRDWETVKTPYSGNTADAHNVISIAVDGEGYLHVSWDHHNTPLTYAKGKSPLSLELGELQSMTGKQEDKVTYPEFHNLPQGDLLFFYRSGESGKGNLIMNRYDVKLKRWIQLQNNLIDGEGERNAYWQACVDKLGTIHLSWVWRETRDVATNHDLAYARSVDGGKTWIKSDGKLYNLPIKLATAEYAYKIRQNSNLINQTSIYADDFGNPYIASYWSEKDIPQYQVVYKDANEWKITSPAFRKTDFQLEGGGTKRIPISRPQILVENNNQDQAVYLLFRDEERNNKASLAYTPSLMKKPWQIGDLTETTVGQWEPSYDIELWKRRKILHLFVQQVEQIDGEGVSVGNVSPVRILEVKR